MREGRRRDLAWPQHSPVVRSANDPTSPRWRHPVTAVRATLPRVTTLLVTNDDGVDSPALIPLVRALQQLPIVQGVNTLVPGGERSWISKSITRFGQVEVEERVGEDGDPRIMIASGTPADCANLGIHTIFPEQPDLVVTGVNVGLNHGMAFVLGSGTVGGASEGAIAGIPAIAFSLGDESGHGAFLKIARGEEGLEIWRSAAEVAGDIVASVLSEGFPDHVDVININFPLDVSLETPRVLTAIAGVGYDALFSHRGENTYRFDYRGLKERRPTQGPTDREVLAAGKISITAMQFSKSTEVSQSLREALIR